jgi:hypothetical protein
MSGWKDLWLILRRIFTTKIELIGWNQNKIQKKNRFSIIYKKNQFSALFLGFIETFFLAD